MHLYAVIMPLYPSWQAITESRPVGTSLEEGAAIKNL